MAVDRPQLAQLGRHRTQNVLACPSPHGLGGVERRRGCDDLARGSRPYGALSAGDAACRSSQGALMKQRLPIESEESS